MTTYVKVEGGIVVQKQPNAEEGFVEAPNNIVCGMPYFETPEEVVAWVAEQTPVRSVSAQPALFAAAAVTIAGGAISSIEQAAQLQGAIYEEGWLMVFFAQPQDASDYLVFAQTDVPATVEQFKDANAFELVFSNQAGDPLEPGRIDIQILKVR